MVRFAQLWSRGFGPVWTWLVAATSGGIWSLRLLRNPIELFEGSLRPSMLKIITFSGMDLTVLYYLATYTEH